jgi:hypothetical protein
VGEGVLGLRMEVDWRSTFGVSARGYGAEGLSKNGKAGLSGCYYLAE